MRLNPRRLLTWWRNRHGRFTFGHDRDTSAWINPITGNDLLAEFNKNDRIKKARKLP